MLTRFRATTLLSVLAAVVAVAFLIPATASAAWGDLDPAFGGGDGIVNPGGSLNTPASTAFQPDGKIVVTGTVMSAGTATAYVQRYLADGSPDPMFGTGGTYLFTALGAGIESQGSAIKIQPDGKIIVAGNAQSGANRAVLLFRVSSTGALDAGGFGGANGYVLSAIGFSNSFFDDVDLIGNDIIASGTVHADATTVRPLVRRYSSAGDPDVTYNNSSSFALGSFSLLSDESHVGVGVTAAGNAIVSFEIYDSGLSTHFAKAVRLVPTGGLDSGYGSSGVATLPDDFTVNTSSIEPDGSVLVAGGRYTTPGYNITTVGHITPAGAPDTGFGTGSVAALDLTPGSRSTVMGVEPMPDGRIVAAVLSFTPGTKPFTSTAVYTSTGALLSTYGSGGVHAYPELGSQSYPYGFALQSDGTAAIVGIGVNGVDIAPYLARVKPEFEPVAKIVPTSKIKRPSKRRLKAKSAMKFSGSAGPAGQVAKVEIALQRVDTKLLKKSRRCRWLSSNKAKFKKIKAVKKKCSAPRWLRAKGTTSWSYKLKRKLPRGNYVLSVRASATDGSVQAKPAVKKFKVT